jgi:hypothetical protein
LADGFNFRNFGNAIGYAFNNNYFTGIAAPYYSQIPNLFGGSFSLCFVGTITINP